MKLSFVIGFHSARLDNLCQTLRFLDKYHGETIQSSELVTVCQDRIPDIKNLTTLWRQHTHLDLNLVEMSLPVVVNTGIRNTSTDKIVVLEGDRILPTGYFDKIAEQLEMPKLQISTKRMKKLKCPTTDAEIQHDSYDFQWENRSENNKLGMRNIWSGNTAFRKSDFLNAGCMDENYIGYGWADNDMHLTMEKAGVKCMFNDDVELHLWHETLTYGVKDQKQLFINNGIYFCKKWNVQHPDFLIKDIQKNKRELLHL